MSFKICITFHRFNRGSLINIGYLISSKQFHCNYFAMHDVDLMPLNGYLSYSFPHQPFHISAPDLHPKYHYEKFIGGIFLINNFQYEMVIFSYYSEVYNKPKYLLFLKNFIISVKI